MGKTSTSSAALAASERSGEAANAAGAELPAPRPLVPDSEVVAGPHRRRFSAEYKLSIIDQADSAQGAGAVGALLRREGLYSSHLATWRQPVSYTHLRAHETVLDLVCRLLLEKKKKKT